MLNAIKIISLVKKVPFWIWILGIAGGYYAWNQKEIRNLKSELVKSQLSADTTTVINDSLSARIAISRKDKEELSAALAAANDLNADLVAAAKIVITPDSIVRDSIIVKLDSTTRTANIHDSTEVGILEANITLKMPSYDIGFSYKFTPAPIDLTISLLRLEDNTAIFAATYRGGRTEIKAPFAKLEPKPKHITWYVGGFRNLTQQVWNFKGGTELRLPFNIHAFAELQQEFGLEAQTQINLGAIKRF